MTKKYLLLFVGAISFLGVQAQDVADVLRMSQQNYGFGTARSAAMGGAYSSLGADMASTVLNPAGLGMYRRSEISISPSVSANGSTTNNITDIARYNSKGSRTNFGLNNFGIAMSGYEGSGAVTSFTFAFGYTRLADFNSDMNVRGVSANSMLDAYSIQMNRSNIVPPSNGHEIPREVFRDNPGLWGGALAYNTYLLDYDQGGFHIPPDLFDADNARLESRFRRATRGSLGQYDISGGMNISNMLYLGMGFGIQSLDYRQTNSYRETPQNNSGFTLNNFNHTQSMNQSGSAWNFKFGAIARPIPNLRISAAIHTPNYMNIEETYVFDMFANFITPPQEVDGVETDSRWPVKYNVQTPTRMLFGASYTIASRAIVSFDYERVWYNKIKSYSSGWSYEDLDFSDYISDVLKPADNLRVGVEAVLIPGVFARAGYASYGNMYSPSSGLSGFGSSYNASIGVGYRTSDFGIDFAYIYMSSKEAPSHLFNETLNWTDNNNVPQETTYSSGTYDVKNIRNTFTLTASMRF